MAPNPENMRMRDAKQLTVRISVIYRENSVSEVLIVHWMSAYIYELPVVLIFTFSSASFADILEV